MIDEAYISVPMYRARIEAPDSGKDILIAADLKAISRLVDREMGQFFNKDAVAVARLYRARWSDCLDLDYEGLCPGIADITGLTIKTDDDDDGVFETTWAATDYELRPLNAAKGPEPRPYRDIIAINRRFPVSRQVEVTAIFGWPEVPELIKALTAKWTRIWRIDGPEGTGRINEMGTVVSMSIDVKRLVDRAAEAYAARPAL